MPAVSKKQRKFFGLVRGLQTGAVSPSKVSSGIKKVAKDVSVSDVRDFAKTKEKGLSLRKRLARRK